VPTAGPRLVRVVITGIFDIIQRPSSYLLIALAIPFIGIYCCLTLFAKSDRLDAARLLAEMCISVVDLFVKNSTVSILAVIICIAIVICVVTVAVCWIAALNITIQRQNERINEIAAGKEALQKMLVEKSDIFKSSIP
jgi:hypothetical protein